MKTKEIQEKLVANMERWKKIENGTISTTGQVIEKTENPIVRLVMEIIQRDSQMHYRVQEMIANSLTSQTISLTPEEVGAVWGMIETHIQMERQTVELAEVSLQQLKGKKMVIQEYLIQYLLEDEKKHEAILERLGKIKDAMYPYG